MKMNRMKEMRKEKNLTQEQVGKILGVSQVAYSHYELEKRHIPVDVLMKLADYYETSVDYVLKRTDQREPFAKSKFRKE